jgi:hypothetical protein
VTISRTDSRIRRERIGVVDVDEHDGTRRCPVCGRVLGSETVETRDVPPRILADASIDVSARAYVCTRHRNHVLALEPAEHAPERYVAVETGLKSREFRLAVPREVAEREEIA